MVLVIAENFERKPLKGTRSRFVGMAQKAVLAIFFPSQPKNGTSIILTVVIQRFFTKPQI